MRKKTTWVGIVFGLALAGLAIAQGFKVYPGARKFTPAETEGSREAAKQMPPGTTQTSYMTDDAFEKVATFYKSVGKEFEMPARGGKLPNGTEIHLTFFILDGAADLRDSKSWVKVQRPYIGSFEMKDAEPVYKDIQDVTSIVYVEKK